MASGISIWLSWWYGVLSEINSTMSIPNDHTENSQKFRRKMTEFDMKFCENKFLFFYFAAKLQQKIQFFIHKHFDANNKMQKSCKKMQKIRKNSL
jgi:hypothetical protein